MDIDAPTAIDIDSSMDRHARDSPSDEKGKRRQRSDVWDSERNGERRPSRKDRSRSRSRSKTRSGSRERERERPRRSRSPRRPRSRSRSRSRSRRDRSRSRDRHSRRRDRQRSRERRGSAFSKSLGGPVNAPEDEAFEMSKTSKRECRVYVGNLSYDVRYRDLMEFMRGAGEVLFAEVLVTPTGISKGCGIVEFGSREDAQKAIRELSEVPLLGRPVFIREDREGEARFGAAPVPGKIGAAMAGQGYTTAPPPRPPLHNMYGGTSAATNPGNQLYVGNLPYQVGWQDLKDMFRKAGSIVRADINIGLDGRAKGSGTVVYETAEDAENAIKEFNGHEWFGRHIEVRPDRYAGMGGGGRGGRGGGRGGRGRDFPARGSYSGGGGRGGYGDDRAHTSDRDRERERDREPREERRVPTGPRAMTGGWNGDVAATQQIIVGNLPWATANEDLVELFETTGNVVEAEVLFENNRSTGSGIVQFVDAEDAGTSIAKFSGYEYGGRPLEIRFNDRWHTFSPSSAKGGTVQPMAV